MAYTTSSVLGVNLNATVAGTTTDGAGAGYALGAVVSGPNGDMWMYVQAGAAITQYACVGIDENYQATMITHANAAAGYKIGFAQLAFADNDFGWVCISGSDVSALLLINCAQDVALYTQATAGYLDDASVTSSIKLDGVVLIATITASGAFEVMASWPRSAAI